MLIEILTSSFKILLILQLSENQTVVGFSVQSWNWAIEFFELVPYSLFIKKIIRFHLLSGYCLFSSLFTFCWNFFMSKSLKGLSSSRSPPDSLMMSFERADSWAKEATFEKEKN